MSKIAILGCGYVGKETALYWKQKGHRITTATRKQERVKELKEIADDVHLLTENRLQDMADLLQGQEALLICVAPTSSDTYQSTYLDTALLLSEVLQDSPTIKHVIYTSSTSVYGDQEGAWVDEETPAQPENPFTKILVDTENVLLSTKTKQRAVCLLRVGEIIGPGRNIVDRLRKNASLPLPGDGENWTNLAHVKDLVRGIDFALERSLCGIYNFCSDEHVRRKELYTVLCKKHGLSEVIWNPQQKSRHAGNKRVSNQKIKNQGFTGFLENPYD